MNFCLPKEFTDKFLKGLKEGKIDPAKMSDMTTEQRRAYLEKFVGKENAPSVNTLFESKLLLQNQKAGMIDWAKTVGGLKPEVRDDIVNKITNLKRALAPEEERQFLSDLAEQKLGLGVTAEEAKTIFDLSQKIEKAKDYSGISTLEDLVTKFEEMPKLSKDQKAAVQSLKDKIQAEKDLAVKEEEALQKERDAIKAEKKAEADAVREDKKIANEAERVRRADERAQKRAEDAGIREQVREDLKKERENTKLATGNSIKRLKAIFGDAIPKDIQTQIHDISNARTDSVEGGDRLAYGRARVALENYVNGLTEKGFVESFKAKPITTLAGTAKSLKASLDNSAIFRQGWRTMFTNPKIWAKNAAKSFSDIVHTFGNRQVMDEIRADLVSRPNYEKYRKAKLAVGTHEESFPTSIPEKVGDIPFLRKVPVVSHGLKFLGKAYKASENAFTGFVYRQRADVFDKYIDIAEKMGVDTEDKHELESIGKLVNSLTGRGDLTSIGVTEKGADLVNNVFFSPRALKANIDTLTLHAGDNMSSFARKEAAKNLVKIIAGTALIMAIANTLKPGSAELDPRSANFGKIKIGTTRFDISGSLSSVITLASRLLSQSTKNSSTGKVTALGSKKFGAQTGWDVLMNFTENKFSPVASVVKELSAQKDFNGKKPTFLGEANTLLTPLPITNAIELAKDPNSAPFLIGTIADALGIATNSYGKK